MSNSDLILHLLEQLMAEREKNIILQQEQKQHLQMQDNNKVKTNM